MSTQTHTCTTVHCDDCGQTYCGYDDIVTHFTDDNEARNDAKQSGWTHPDDQDICERCTAARICQQDGHIPSLTEFLIREGHNYHYCTRCDQVIGLPEGMPE